MAGFDALPPWEALPWFQAPKVTVVTTAMGLNSLVGADPMRVILYISSPANAGAPISPDPASLTGLTPAGLVLTTSVPWIRFTAAQDGPLCASQWWTFDSAGGAKWLVIEVALKDWPRPKVPYGPRQIDPQKSTNRYRDLWPDPTARTKPA